MSSEYINYDVRIPIFDNSIYRPIIFVVPLVIKNILSNQC